MSVSCLPEANIEASVHTTNELQVNLYTRDSTTYLAEGSGSSYDRAIAMCLTMLL